MKESCSKRWGTATYIVQHTLDLQRRFGHLDPLPTSPYKYPQRYFRNHSAAALNDPSFPAFTFGSLKSPLTANPWVQPSKYSRLYPGANFPPPKISSAIFCASFGNRESTSQLLIRRGALTVDAYFCFFLKRKGGDKLGFSKRKFLSTTCLEIVWDYEKRRVGHHRNLDDILEREIENVPGYK